MRYFERAGRVLALRASALGGLRGITEQLDRGGQIQGGGVIATNLLVGQASR